MAGERVTFEEIRDVLRAVRESATVPQLKEWVEAMALDMQALATQVGEIEDVKASVTTLLVRLADEARIAAADEAGAQAALNEFADRLDAAHDDIAAAVVANTPADTSDVPSSTDDVPSTADGSGNGGSDTTSPDTGTEPSPSPDNTFPSGDNPTDSTPSSGNGEPGDVNDAGTVTLPDGGVQQ